MISLCMIVKNEEKTLDKCLNNMINIVDEIIIVDTGSSDKTKEIALKYTENVFDFKWCNDFAKARNYSISKASNDWILVLDADEIVKKYDINIIKEFCRKENNEVVGRIKIINEYEDNYGTKKYIERVNRLFNKSYFQYEGIIHEQIISKSEKKYEAVNVNLIVDHIGYSKEVVNRTKKIERNIELLKTAEKENSKDPYIYYQLGKSYFMGKRFNEAYKNFRKSLTLVNNFKYEYVEDLIESYGYTLVNLGLFEEALNINIYIKYYYNSPDFIFLLALIEMNNGNFKKATETFLKCTELKEGKIEGITSFLPLYNIGVILECSGSRDEAMKYYKLCGNYAPAQNRIEIL